MLKVSTTSPTSSPVSITVFFSVLNLCRKFRRKKILFVKYEGKDRSRIPKFVVGSCNEIVGARGGREEEREGRAGKESDCYRTQRVDIGFMLKSLTQEKEGMVGHLYLLKEAVIFFCVTLRLFLNSYFTLRPVGRKGKRERDGLKM